MPDCKLSFWQHLFLAIAIVSTSRAHVNFGHFHTLLIHQLGRTIVIINKNGLFKGHGLMMPADTSFRKYCENTSLHGWQYIYHSSQKGWRFLWAGMVFSSVVIAFCFVFKQTSEFTKATVVTTVDTTTAPLDDVYFPAVTICNINQVMKRILFQEKKISSIYKLSGLCLFQ